MLNLKDVCFPHFLYSCQVGTNLEQSSIDSHSNIHTRARAHTHTSTHARALIILALTSTRTHFDPASYSLWPLIVLTLTSTGTRFEFDLLSDFQSILFFSFLLYIYIILFLFYFFKYIFPLMVFILTSQHTDFNLSLYSPWPLIVLALTSHHTHQNNWSYCDPWSYLLSPPIVLILTCHCTHFDRVLIVRSLSFDFSRFNISFINICTSSQVSSLRYNYNRDGWLWA